VEKSHYPALSLSIA